MLEVVVTDGTAQSSKLEGYRAAGKTGTAQKIDETGRYSRTKYVASFAGYAPASNPVVALIVVVDEPVGLYGGGQVAAPSFKRVAEQVLRYMSVPPDVPLYAPEYKDKLGIHSAGIKPAATPTPGAPDIGRPVAAGFTPASLSTEGPPIGAIAVPDFNGKSLRQVTEESLKLGLKLRSSGSGAAVEQFPAAGTYVRPGARIQVRFSTRSRVRRAANEK
jgi:membrane peptidoglycan carboxypeptidase